MFERMTERARHLLLGLLTEEEGLAAQALNKLGVHTTEARALLLGFIGQTDTQTSGQIPFTPRAKKILELSLREALSLGHNYIGTEHLLLALVREDSGTGAAILRHLNVESTEVSAQILQGISTKGLNERIAEYEICKRRGHTPSTDISGRDRANHRERCRHCGTTYWTETVQREADAPIPIQAVA